MPDAETAILPEIQDLFYKKELQAFINSFVEPLEGIESGKFPDTVPTTPEQVLADIKEIFQTQGFMHPSDLRQALVEKYLPNASPELMDIFKQFELSRYNPDSMTEFMQKPHLGLSSGLGHLYATSTDRPVTMVEVDYSNMGGTNDFHQIQILREQGTPEAEKLIEMIELKATKPQEFDKFLKNAVDNNPDLIKLFKDTQAHAFKLTDDSAKLVALTIEDQVRKIVPEGADFKILPIRAGGDELRLIVEGVDPSAYPALERAIHNAIEGHMARLNLHNHVHLKGPNDRLKDGYGAAVALVDMRDIDAMTAVEDADKIIKANKLVLGRYRLGEIDPVLLKQEYKALFEARPDLRPGPQGLSAEEAVEHIWAKVKSAAESHAQTVRADFERQKPDQNFSIKDREAYLNAANEDLIARRQNNIEPQKLDFLNDIEVEYEPFSTPAERRAQAIEAYINQNGMNISDYERNLLEDYAMRTTPVDPSAGVLMPDDMPAIVQIYAQDTARLSAELGQDLHAQQIGAAFHNLGGLNDLLGHDGANVALRTMAHDIFEQALLSEGLNPGDFQIAHYGGAEFQAVIKPAIPDSQGGWKIIDSEATARIQNKIEELSKGLSTERVIDFLSRKGALTPELEKSLGDMTFGEVQDIKKDRNISGIDVVTHRSEVELGNDTAGRYMAAQRDALEVNVNQFRSARSSSPNISSIFKSKMKDYASETVEAVADSKIGRGVSKVLAEAPVLGRIAKFANKIPVVGIGIGLGVGTGFIAMEVADKREMIDAMEGLPAEFVKEYKKYLDECEEKMHADNALGTADQTFVASLGNTINLDIEMRDRLLNLCDEYNIKQDEFEKLKLNMFGGETIEEQFTNTIKDMLLNRDVPESLSDLKNAVLNLNAAHHQSVRELRHQTSASKAEHKAGIEAAQEKFYDELDKVLENPEALKDLYSTMDKDVALDVVERLVRAGVVETDNPQLQQLAELSRLLQKTSSLYDSVLKTQYSLVESATDIALKISLEQQIAAIKDDLIEHDMETILSILETLAQDDASKEFPQSAVEYAFENIPDYSNENMSPEFQSLIELKKTINYMIDGIDEGLTDMALFEQRQKDFVSMVEAIGEEALKAQIEAHKPKQDDVTNENAVKSDLDTTTMQRENINNNAMSMS